MESFFDKEVYTIEDIEQLIKDNTEESLMLEFKRNTAAKHNKEIAKDISAFANSAGGIIIYGLEEKDHCAKSLSFINGNLFTKETLENIIASGIQKRVEGIRIFPIRNNSKIEESIYVVKIPESKKGPHMAGGKYYRRLNFQVMPMEENDVRSSYFKSQKPILKINTPIFHDLMKGYWRSPFKKTGTFRLIFNIENIGKILEKDYKLEIFISNKIYKSIERVYPSNLEKFKIIKYDGILDKHFAVPGKESIFPLEIIEVTDTYIKIDNERFLEERISLNLFYSGGITSRKFTLNEIFKIQEEANVFHNTGYKDVNF